jgi:signal transduction histidine kinase
MRRGRPRSCGPPRRRCRLLNAEEVEEVEGAKDGVDGVDSVDVGGTAGRPPDRFARLRGQFGGLRTEFEGLRTEFEGYRGGHKDPAALHRFLALVRAYNGAAARWVGELHEALSDRRTLARENARLSRAAAAARAERDRVLTHARCLLWRATVEDRGTHLHWDLAIVNEAAARRFFPVANPHPEQHPDFSYAAALYESRPAEDKARMGRFAEAMVRANQGYTQDFRIVRADGEVRWLRERVEVTPRGAGRWEAVGVAVDVTDEKRLEALRREEERLRREVAVAEAKAQAREEHFAVAAHELRTPITTLWGYAQQLQRVVERGVGENGDVRVERERLGRALHTIDEQSRKLTALVNQLLDVARLEQGRPLPLDYQRTELDLLVQRVVTEFRQRFPSRQFRFEAPESVAAEVDQLRIEQVVANLLDNAVKYSADGPIDVGVYADLRPDAFPAAPAAAIVVRDHGRGIPAEQREQVFERFHQVHLRQGVVSGMGVGLYVSRQIVEQHGGAMALDEPEGGGARFTVWLPLRAPGFAGGAAGGSEGTTEPAAAGGGPLG